VTKIEKEKIKKKSGKIFGIAKPRYHFRFFLFNAQKLEDREPKKTSNQERSFFSSAFSLYFLAHSKEEASLFVPLCPFSS